MSSRWTHLALHVRSLQSSIAFYQRFTSLRVVDRHSELGDLGATEALWQEASRTGTPVIEPAEGNPSEVIVRFVWRGNANTRNVALLAPLTYSC
jgi:catechol 2,3-dioxygenase-like lactoylglutathione lyase family enzyme